MMLIWEKRKNIYLMKRAGFMTPAVAWSVVALFVFACRLASLKGFVTCGALFALVFVDALMPSGRFCSSWDKKTGPAAVDSIPGKRADYV